MLRRLSLNVDNPVSDPLIDPAGTHGAGHLTSEVVVGEVLVVGQTSAGSPARLTVSGR